MTLTAMDYVRAALANAMAEGLDLTDVWQAADEATSCKGFDENVNAAVHGRDALVFAFLRQGSG